MLRITCNMSSGSMSEIEIAESKDSIEENTFQSGSNLDANTMTTSTKQWERHRTNLFRLFVFYSLITGISTRLYHQTEYFYFRDNLHVHNPDFFYGVSTTVLSVSTVISVFIGSFYYDVTRDCRSIGILANFFGIVGNIIYMLGYSPYLVLFGNFIIGMRQLEGAVGLAELFQIYENEVLTKKMMYFLLVALLGSLIAPCIIFAFESVNVYVKTWHLNVNNTVALIMAILYSVSFILAILYMENVSLQYNLKKENTQNAQITQNAQNTEKLHEEKENEDGKEVINTGEASDIGEGEASNEAKNGENSIQRFDYKLSSPFSGFNRIFGNFRIVSLYLIDFLVSYISMTLLLLLALKSSQYLNWKQPDIAKANLLSRVVGSIPFFLIIIGCRNKLKDIDIIIISITSSALATISLIIIPYIAKDIAKTVLFYVYNIFCMIAASLFQTINRTMIAKRAPFELQARAESVRFFLFQLGVSIAGLTIDIIDLHTMQALIVILFFPVVIVAILISFYNKFTSL